MELRAPSLFLFVIRAKDRIIGTLVLLVFCYEINGGLLSRIEELERIPYDQLRKRLQRESKSSLNILYRSTLYLPLSVIL